MSTEAPMTGALTVRPYRPADRDDVYDVCVRTGDAGADARGRFSTDDLLPDVYAGPYLALEPELATVVDDGTRVVGYVLGTADTTAWAAANRARWLPTVADRYPLVEPPTTPEDRLVALLHHPERAVHPELADHPAHLHVDLLPQVQGRGLGRLLLRTFLTSLRVRGVPAVHLGASATNTAALAFYDRLGFRELELRVPGVVFLGARTDLVV
ncbi:MAG TPA: GNAT family N-acetyltransferase [Actinotalea sp.]|nr:GNAT family N-acetyltransferase [Actinotalea sp.]